jgi:hypothetical protein
MNANDIVMNYIAAWNERDPAKRRATVAKAWAPLYLGGTDFIRVGPDGLSSAVVGFVDATPAM